MNHCYFCHEDVGRWEWELHKHMFEVHGKVLKYEAIEAKNIIPGYDQIPVGYWEAA